MLGANYQLNLYYFVNNEVKRNKYKAIKIFEYNIFKVILKLRHIYVFKKKKKFFLRKKVGHGPRCPSPMDHLVVRPETILTHFHEDYTNAESFRAAACLEDSEKSISRFCYLQIKILMFSERS